MAETVALAVVENLVHMSRADFPSGYVVIGAMIPAWVKIATRDDLVAMIGHQDTHILGDYWLNLALSAVLAVRSVVVPHERNFLLN
jgi:RES domain-containing protein